MAGATDAQQVLDFRYPGGVVRGVNINKATIVSELWDGAGEGTSSQAYAATRGLEQLWSVNDGENSANAIAPVSEDNPRYVEYIVAGQESGNAPCP